VDNFEKNLDGISKVKKGGGGTKNQRENKKINYEMQKY
jgi:hypothetical protein